MALAPVVTALIEPGITGARFERHNLLLGILVIPGVALVVGGIPERHAPGVLGGCGLGGTGRACSTRSTSVTWAITMRWP